MKDEGGSVNKRLIKLCVAAALTATLSMGTATAAQDGGEGWDPESRATAQGSIFNTRHNFTMLYGGAALQNEMGLRLNIYNEVCVYCHTPHAGNSQIAAPIWNRTINTNQYTVFDKVRMLNQPITQPGPSSLTCLSCHDGTISPDSIINMPGSGRYSKAAETVWDPIYLDRWAAQYGQKGPVGGATGHKRLQRSNTSGESCMACHNINEVAAGAAPAPDFTVFSIEEDLRDDHPIGILFPYLFGESLIPGRDFWVPTATLPGKMDFFDTDGDGRADTDEVRLYDTGDGPEVECASCHDPHGIPSAGKGSRFNPSFLRVNNLSTAGSNSGPGVLGITPSTNDHGSNGSALCLTCHDK